MKLFKVSFPPVVRNIEANQYFENFLVFSVLSIVSIRFFLRVTNYPQLGSGGLHIAHMLWGGLLMTAAVLMVLLFLNKAIHQLASILAGIGFGTFIDELGKFITLDNNYFYQPTFALIYVIFVVVYLSYIFIHRRATYSQTEYLANALEATKEAVILDFDSDEQQQALSWLKLANPNISITKTLTRLVKNEQPIEGKPSIFINARQGMTRIYRTFVQTAWARRLMTAFFVTQVFGYFSLALLLVVWRNTRAGFVFELQLGFFGWGLVISSALAVVLLAFGLMQMVRKKRRIHAYRFFRYSLLINILLVTFFAFNFNQLIVLGNLVANILFLKTIEYAQLQEKQLTGGLL